MHIYDIRERWINTMAVDGLAPCVNRISAAIDLILLGWSAPKGIKNRFLFKYHSRNRNSHYKMVVRLSLFLYWKDGLIILILTLRFFVMFKLQVLQSSLCYNSLRPEIECSTFCRQHFQIYRKVSNIRRTKSPNLNVSCFVLQLSLLNPMKPGVKSRTKM